MRILIGAALLAAAPLFALAQDKKPAPTYPEIGKEAPAFRLNDQTGKAIEIGGKKGTEDRFWTVLAFYPKAGTAG